MSESSGSEQNTNWSTEKDWPAIHMPDGRWLKFYTNSSLETIGSQYSDLFQNIFQKEKYLVELGILEAPEIPATDMAGNELANDIALYVDSRLDTKLLYDLDSWLREHTPQYFDLFAGAVASREEIRAAVDQGLESTGLGAALGQLKQQDQAQPSELLGLDLAELMRTMRDQL